MADPTFGYRIAIDGFENIATDAGKAFTAISTGADQSARDLQKVGKEADEAQAKLRKLNTGGGDSPFNAIDAARERAAANAGRTFSLPSGPVALAVAAVPDSSLDRLGPTAGALDKYTTAANTAALASKGMGNEAAGIGGGLVVASAAVGAAKIAFDVLSSSVQAFAEKEAAIAKLQGAMAGVGETSKQVSNDITELVEKLQDASGIDSSKLLGAAGDLIERGVKLAQLGAALTTVNDIAGATGSAEKATALYAATMNGSFAAINKFGAALKEGATELEKFEALQRVAAIGAGQNEANLKTLQGGWTQLKNAISNSSESVGGQVAKFLHLNGAMELLTRGLEGPEKPLLVNYELLQQHAAAAKAADEATAALSQRERQLGDALNEVSTTLERSAETQRQNDRTRRREDSAEERAAAEDDAQALKEIARREAGGEMTSETAASLRTQIAKNRAVDDAARASQEAAAKAKELAREEAALVIEVNAARDAFKKLTDEQKESAKAGLAEAEKQLRSVTEKKEDADDAAANAESKLKVAEEARDAARSDIANSKRIAAEKEAEQAGKEADRAKDRADKEKDRADKERERAAELLADAVDKENEALDRLNGESDKPKLDKNGRKIIRSLSEEDSRRRDQDRQAPDRTTGTEVAENNKAKAEAAKSAAEAAKQAGKDIETATAASLALIQLMAGNIGGMLTAFEALKNTVTQQGQKIDSLRV